MDICKIVQNKQKLYFCDTMGTIFESIRTVDLEPFEQCESIGATECGMQEFRVCSAKGIVKECYVILNIQGEPYFLDRSRLHGDNNYPFELFAKNFSPEDMISAIYGSVSELERALACFHTQMR